MYYLSVCIVVNSGASHFKAVLAVAVDAIPCMTSFVVVSVQKQMCMGFIVQSLDVSGSVGAASTTFPPVSGRLNCI